MADTRERPEARDRPRSPAAPARPPRARVPQLSAEFLDLWGREWSRAMRRSNIRQSLTDALLASDAVLDHHKPRIKRELGRLARAGRDLAAPLEQTRHHMLRYFDMVFCGNEFYLSDPMHCGTVKNAMTSNLIRILKGWQGQLIRYVDKHDLRMSASEAMGMHDDDDEEA